MSAQESALTKSLDAIMTRRKQSGLPLLAIDGPFLSSAPDFFSNDYLSLSTSPLLRELFLSKALSASRLFGATGCRLATGSGEGYRALEERLVHFFQSLDALLRTSGCVANEAFWSMVPQPGNVLIFDQLVHSSIREAVLGGCFEEAPCTHAQIMQGSGTVFVAIESVYSMDGDFSPLEDIVRTVDELVPKGHAHICVDEAHTSGIFGPDGRGYVALLGLKGRIHTMMHTLGKAWRHRGGQFYLVDYAKAFGYTTTMAHMDVYILNSCLDIISGPKGQELRNKLSHIVQYAYALPRNAFRPFPAQIVALTLPSTRASDIDLDRAAAKRSAELKLYSPAIPLLTPHAVELAEYLIDCGYNAGAVTYPAVKVSRVRVIMHAGNTQAEVDRFVEKVVEWATEKDQTSSQEGNRGGEVLLRRGTGSNEEQGTNTCLYIRTIVAFKVETSEERI
ncbi:8-amino-7-oxononanoate synthase [Pisolithus orientalis]|uniref:8-amino-7-oxononanoate synthase n=1 Tax=Pisolithus orientalis TaxID=936130 RepID=UPI002224B399|nr:8-amino-7-oxononanoate synthase [Pisolithus orientalis]KAI5997256.1 8-amino-7-oxononanoate synthase [Pisolithus orientalis]